MSKTKKTPAKRTPAVPYERFVKLWSTAATVGEVAKKLGIKTSSASATANRLRKKGVKLRRFPRRVAQPVDTTKLNRIASGR
jgi:DNA-binding MarR family transcriptional regulator